MVSLEALELFVVTGAMRNRETIGSLG